jgi:hypothetical protein
VRDGLRETCDSIERSQLSLAKGTPNLQLIVGSPFNQSMNIDANRSGFYQTRSPLSIAKKVLAADRLSVQDKRIVDLQRKKSTVVS